MIRKRPFKQVDINNYNFNVDTPLAAALLLALLYSYFFELEVFITINRQKHYAKYLHEKLETKDIRCI